MPRDYTNTNPSKQVRSGMNEFSKARQLPTTGRGVPQMPVKDMRPAPKGQ